MGECLLQGDQCNFEERFGSSDDPMSHSQAFLVSPLCGL